MDTGALTSFLGWCFIINMCVMLYWLGFILFARNWVYAKTRHWFLISEEHFDLAQYALLGGYKLAIVFFIAVPYIALKISF